MINPTSASYILKLFRNVIVISLSLVFAPDQGIARNKGFSSHEIASLAKDLSDKYGWNIGPLKVMLSHHKVERLHDTVKLNITNPIKLSMRKYKHFTEPFAMKLANRFNNKWITTIKRAANRYKVDPAVISAILLVETSYGNFKGDYSLVSVFGSTYLDAKALEKSSQTDGLSEKAKARISRKKNWALEELSALVKIKRRYKSLDIHSLRGSYAGAFGICQFLPSSYLNHAVRAKGNGRPDLFWEPDAIYSVANYLNRHGFKKPSGSQQSKEAIFAYNNSDVYVDTVLAVAKKIAYVFR